MGEAETTAVINVQLILTVITWAVLRFTVQQKPHWTNMIAAIFISGTAARFIVAAYLNKLPIDFIEQPLIISAHIIISAMATLIVALMIMNGIYWILTKHSFLR